MLNATSTDLEADNLVQDSVFSFSHLKELTDSWTAPELFFLGGIIKATGHPAIIDAKKCI